MRAAYVFATVSALILGVLGGAAPAPASAMPTDWPRTVAVSEGGRNASDQNVAIADDGSMIAVWSSFDGSTKTIQSSISRDEGVSWTPPTNISVPGIDTFRSQVVISPKDGRVMAVWGTWDGFYNRLQVATSTDGGATWGVPVDLPTGDADDPRVAVTDEGTFVVSWTRIVAPDGYQVQISTSNDGGASWAAPVSLSMAGKPAYDAQIAVTATGSISAVWARNNGFRPIIQSSTSHDDGATWTAPVDISEPSVYAVVPMLAAHGGETMTAVWQGNDGSASFVQASTSRDAGATWSDPAVLSEDGRDSFNPQLAAAGNGNVAVVWSGRSTGRDIISSSVRDAGSGTWSAASGVSGTGRNASYPRIAGTGDGKLTVAWFDGTGFETGTIRAAASLDAGAAWSMPFDLGASGKMAEYPSVAISHSGRVVTAWKADEGGHEILRAATFASEVSQVTLRTAWVSAAAGDRSTISLNNREVGNSRASGANGPDLGSTVTHAVPVGSVVTISQRLSDSNAAKYSASVSCDHGGAVADGGTFTVTSADVLCTFTNTLIPGVFVTGTPVVSQGLPSVGESLTVAVGDWSPQPSSFTYQWLRDGAKISGATQSSYTVRAADLGSELSVVVTGAAERYTPASVTSAPTAAVSNGAVSTTRLSGSDRYATAVSISRQFESASRVYLATGEGYADALGAGPVAARFGAPLLLTRSGSLPPSVKTELERLRPQRVVIVGGTGAVSAAVERAIKALPFKPTVQRIAGADRYETSRNLAKATWAASELGTAYLATGSDFPDALSASPAAAHFDGPVVLVRGTSPAMDAGTLSLLRSLGVDSVEIAGGAGAVSAGIERELRTILGAQNVARNGGGDRYATSVTVNEKAFESAEVVYLATGSGYADALAGAALAGKNDAPLYISRRDCIPREVTAAIRALGSTRVVLLGGDGVLSSGVAKLKTCG
ncbi:cell wall-binding repeat-containing protein [Microbacterium sp. zg.Y909]|uniref:cell wall-binding repeat-containing protein n=1 Tax=Microbacterium sp. zg.Y909 TaxID=2969413 RepID=UPI00214AE292|nr:cell wall-binding repeat-containing protein [Microbacterium sp. zg.Y909]MCR2824306.1 cell wall-binding repeat-containing protein [Microbacterium sp. zg.Y909]